MAGLEAHRGAVRLSAQLGVGRMSGLARHTSRGYLLPTQSVLCQESRHQVEVKETEWRPG